MKVGITGVEGFLGSHLRTELRNRGHEVIGIDIVEAGLPPYDQRTQFSSDLREPDVASRWLYNNTPDICVHMAAQVGRLFGDRDLRHTVESNATMTTLIAKACGDLNIPLAYTSTSEVYGDNGDRVSDERDGPFSLPHNLYGLTKRWGEEVSRLYAYRDLVIFRPSMPYGTGVVPGQGRAALPNIIWQVVTGQRIPIHRGSERSWCWVGDAVRGMAVVLEAGETGPFNIGRDDDARSMQEVAELACAMFGGDPGMIDLIDPPEAQTVVKRLSTDRLRGLGWMPTVSLEAGMSLVRQWVEKFDDRGRERDG